MPMNPYFDWSNTMLISERAKSLALQAILFFVMARAEGKSRSEAVSEFVESELCRAFGDTLTVGNVYGLAEAGGYDP
jgi:hypothetical protein